ncbi:hypothetical protein GF318_02550 [Candidatus Micrarchaeota archaeon]|nr:hypothetical protein [Candidatus Micrarchaeota archaeon]
MSKRRILLPIAVALSIGTAGVVGYGGYLTGKARQARETRIHALVDRFKACPDRFEVTNECFSPTERRNLQKSAFRNRREDNHEKAGEDFAKLGRFNEAREMASECASGGNEECRDKLVEDIKIRREAIRRAKKQD